MCQLLEDPSAYLLHTQTFFQKTSQILNSASIWGEVLLEIYMPGEETHRESPYWRDANSIKRKTKNFQNIQVDREKTLFSKQKKT